MTVKRIISATDTVTYVDETGKLLLSFDYLNEPCHLITGSDGLIKARLTIVSMLENLGIHVETKFEQYETAI